MKKVNILCTSKPCDGLLYYSYEYCCYLNSIGVTANLIIITNPKFSEENYCESIKEKYTTFENIIINDIIDDNTPILVMGRSMITMAYLDRYDYTMDQRIILSLLLKNKIIAVYSENHGREYTDALEHFKPKEVIDLCDYDVYPNGVGNKFEKRIYFDIHKPIHNEIEFDYLFNGSNRSYYADVMKVIKKYPSHGIMVYNLEYINNSYNHILIPVKNLLGKFNTYVYTKSVNDPAPRIIQECKYHNKNIIFENTNVGAETYYKRKLLKPDVGNIINEI